LPFSASAPSLPPPTGGTAAAAIAMVSALELRCEVDRSRLSALEREWKAEARLRNGFERGLGSSAEMKGCIRGLEEELHALERRVEGLQGRLQTCASRSETASQHCTRLEQELRMNAEERRTAEAATGERHRRHDERHRRSVKVAEDLLGRLGRIEETSLALASRLEVAEAAAQGLLESKTLMPSPLPIGGDSCHCAEVSVQDCLDALACCVKALPGMVDEKMQPLTAGLSDLRVKQDFHKQRLDALCSRGDEVGLWTRRQACGAEATGCSCSSALRSLRLELCEHRQALLGVRARVKECWEAVVQDSTRPSRMDVEDLRRMLEWSSDQSENAIAGLRRDHLRVQRSIHEMLGSISFMKRQLLLGDSASASSRRQLEKLRTLVDRPRDSRPCSLALECQNDVARLSQLLSGSGGNGNQHQVAQSFSFEVSDDSSRLQTQLQQMGNSLQTLKAVVSETQDALAGVQGQVELHEVSLARLVDGGVDIAERLQCIQRHFAVVEADSPRSCVVEIDLGRGCLRSRAPDEVSPSVCTDSSTMSPQAGSVDLLAQGSPRQAHRSGQLELGSLCMDLSPIVDDASSSSALGCSLSEYEVLDRSALEQCDAIEEVLSTSSTQ